MELNKDFRDLCALLNARNVEYLIVGTQLSYRGRADR